MSAPLSGVRVLDLSRLLPGPACSWVLAGMGASVDRIEPLSGDPARHLPPSAGDVGAYFAAVHRGKRSAAIDLRHDEGREIIRTLVKHYDVFIEGFRPGVLEAMGLAPEALHALHPGLIIARISGFGQTGPWAQRPGHDLNYVGLAGALLTAPGAAAPPNPTVQSADMAGALTAASQIAAALFVRERTGQGTVIDVSLAQSALLFSAPLIASMTASQREPSATGELLSGALPTYAVYRCKDGRHLTVGALEPKFLMALQAVVGDDMSREALTKIFATEPRDHWVERLEGACVGPALTPMELASHPHWQSRDIAEVEQGTTFVDPPTGRGARGPVPTLGEHTHDILTEAGLSAERLQALVASGVIA